MTAIDFGLKGFPRSFRMPSASSRADISRRLRAPPLGFPASSQKSTKSYAKDLKLAQHAAGGGGRGLDVTQHKAIAVSRSQRWAGSASMRGCHIAEITISGVRTGSSKVARASSASRSYEERSAARARSSPIGGNGEAGQRDHFPDGLLLGRDLDQLAGFAAPEPERDFSARYRPRAFWSAFTCPIRSRMR